MFFTGETKLAEVVCERKKTKWVGSYRRKERPEVESSRRKAWSEVESSRRKAPSNKFEADPATIVNYYATSVFTFISYASHLEPKHFLKGVSGAEKEENLDCIGKFGDGMTSALAVLAREGVNVTVLTKGFTTKAMIDPSDGAAYLQHERNHQERHRVTFVLTFKPKELSNSFSAPSPSEVFNPEAFDPMSICLDPDEDKAFVVATGQDFDPSVDHDLVLLDKDMRGEMYNRLFHVSSHPRTRTFSGTTLPTPTALSSRAAAETRWTRTESAYP